MSRLDALRDAYQDLDSRTRLRIAAGIAVLLVIALLLSSAHAAVSKLARKRQAREADLVELMQLKGRFHSARALSQRFANRLAATKADDTPAKIVDEIGIKGKSLRVTPLKTEQRGSHQEDAAEIRIEGLTANEAVNLLFRLEKGSRPVIINKAHLKTRFDDPSRLDLTLTAALLKAAAPGQK
jgi:general secretion pathway protein M